MGQSSREWGFCPKQTLNSRRTHFWNHLKSLRSVGNQMRESQCQASLTGETEPARRASAPACDGPEGREIADYRDAMRHLRFTRPCDLSSCTPKKSLSSLDSWTLVGTPMDAPPTPTPARAHARAPPPHSPFRRLLDKFLGHCILFSEHWAQ